VYTDKGIFYYKNAIDWSSYLFQSIQAVTEDDQILHINNLLRREVTLENCLIVDNTKDQVRIFSEGFQISLPCRNLAVEFSNEIADIHLTNGSVTKISTKKDSISGKILSVRQDGIELEGYGVVPLAENFRF
jgi:stage II sporulation protein D